LEYFIEAIHQWYHKHQRALPWRETKDPYRIWVSEIILQQTRVEQGLPYYERFIGHFPDVLALAESSGDQLMKIWEGLGYYSRARHMHAAAKLVAMQYQGIFPEKYEDIRRLKGIGEYTAAAIASIAFGEPYAVVDGNVYRFLSRFLGITTPVDTTPGKKVFNRVAQELLDRNKPGYHNQAMMEFGALCCIPRNPGCQTCPVVSGCYAFQHKMTDTLPVKNKKPARKIRYLYFYVAEDEDSVIIEKRTGNDIWKHLYQFPVHEQDQPVPEPDLLSLPFTRAIPGLQVGEIPVISRQYIHLLTHQEIRARFIRKKHLLLPDNFPEGMRINKGEIHTFAFPVLIKKYILENFPGGTR
jgi:A/G-specific adenine glycosylase